MTKAMLIAVAAGTALSAYLLWTVANSSATSPRLPGSAAAGSLDERLDRLIEAQEEQSRRLDRLESMLGASSGARPPASGPMTLAAAAKNLHGADSEVPLTAAQQAQKLQDLQSQMESKFVSEPYSASWAPGTEKLIDGAFAASNLAYENSPAPISRKAECRSNSCRISIVYKDDVQADIGQQFLLGDIASRLPKAKLLRVSNPDGTVEVIAYAHTAPGHR